MKDVLEQRAKQKRADYLHRLLWETPYTEPTQLSPRELKLISVATRINPNPYGMELLGITRENIQAHAEECAYYTATQQPCKCRDVILPSHENKMVAWCAAQICIISLLFYGITPLTGAQDLLLSRHIIFVLFLALIAITVWRRHNDNWYNEHKRRTSLLNVIVGNTEIEHVLKSKTFAEDMRRLYLDPECKYKPELTEYLRWWYDIFSDNTPFDEWIKNTNLNKQ